MKPVRREELLKSESAKDTVIKPKKKSSSKEVRKPKKAISSSAGARQENPTQDFQPY